ncbi:butyrate kinase [Dongshaea marina]|uniref:butyrate kinase n=1 Tax=Dongshaea marina TaxID=2047966 RepID=UPI000D3E79AD|nr:butyrate kinase [Dongshaea marina]
MKILAINPGGMSTKIAVYENERELFCKSIGHSMAELAPFKKVADQKAYRKQLILDSLKEKGIDLSEIDQFVGRGGMVRNLESGVYRINEAYLHDASVGLNGEHASNLGGVLADELAKEVAADKIAYTVDPVMVDEYEEIAKFSGMADISRVRSFHALNHKAVATRYAKDLHKPISGLNLIVAHLGSGVSIGAHKAGRIVDVNSALGGDGPFSPERAGGVPPLALIDMCFSGKYSYLEIYKKLIGEGGVYSYLGTKDMREVERRALGGDAKANQIFEAMAYQVAKEIGACAVALSGKVDAILLTGSIAHSGLLTDWISSRVQFITSEVVIYPGEDEMQALCQGTYDALRGLRPILDY